MTEAEWLACDDDALLTRHVRERITPRKKRLIACGWCRLHWAELTDGRSKHAVGVGERFADAVASEAELERAYYQAADASEDLCGSSSLSYTVAMWADSCVNADESAWENAAEASHPTDAECKRIADLIREIVGNPFREVVVAPIWRTPAVHSLAVAAYDERSLRSGRLDLARLAVLSDALEEAGCDDAALLSHLRSPGPHVRGCWALDLVLGKE